MTAQEQLQQLNNAISTIENGAQEYQIGSRKLRRPDLSVLYQERRRLQQMADQEAANAPQGVFVAVFDRR